MQEEFVLHEMEDHTREEILINSGTSEDSYLDSWARLKPLFEEPLDLELKKLPSQLEYAFLKSGS